MLEETWEDKNGRRYTVLVEPGQNPETGIVKGPPEGLVDELGFPEPFATRLHNALHARGMLNYRSLAQKSRELVGVLQEVFSVDAQLITEAYLKFEKEETPK